jgi:hypothetical protein
LSTPLNVSFFQSYKLFIGKLRNLDHPENKPTGQVQRCSSPNLYLMLPVLLEPRVQVLLPLALPVLLEPPQQFLLPMTTLRLTCRGPV